MPKVLKSYGTAGEVLTNLAADGDINLKEPVFIAFDELPVPFFFESASQHGSRTIVKFEGVDSLADAEELVGRAILADIEFEEDEFEDFTGWKILDNGKTVGICTGIEPIPGNPCLMIGEILIPLHEDFIIEADPALKELNLNLPLGLY